MHFLKASISYVQMLMRPNLWDSQQDADFFQKSRIREWRGEEGREIEFDWIT